jgi:tetratricopeptide (TPR) repeat protein
MRRILRLLPAAAVLAGSLLPVLLVLHARRVNGSPGFPLDDPWIHLTFARNLAEHGTFAYFPGDRSVSGSTSPLFTFLLAAGWKVIRDEKLLAHALGIAAHAGFLVTVALWARRRGLEAAWGAAAVAVVAFEPRVVLLAASGMETSLFLLLVAASFAAHASGKRTAEGIALGLATWARPEGLLLALVLSIDLALARDRRGILRGTLALATILAAYVTFNLVVGGTLLPNTFAAKTAYYGGNPRWGFVRADVLATFATWGWAVLLPLAAWAAPRRRAEAGWVVALVLVYVALLPFAHRFERYLVPALPALAVLGVSAARALPFGKLSGFALALAVALNGSRVPAAFESYTKFCRYHLERHERAGRWLAANTQPTAVIAAHDVGALAFYSERRVIDTVGVVLPEAVGHLHQAGYLDYLRALFDREGVTHVAFLRNWLEVSNVEPLFVPTPEPEILVISPWISGRTHLVPEAATVRNDEASTFLSQGNARAALERAEDSLAIDPDNAQTWLLRGAALEALGRTADAEASYRVAVRLQPDSRAARFRLAALLR